ncbi:hypothetical protein [Streptomyces abikoensis]|uniref:hypothetical protein n=1 Tax=Streptomyces abikoensis TaxID=97398 RepID=UPI0016763768|nr:hypothetical protein [Streptomyces abikoensis]GGP36402.1 hypothetical protein GCM10010214_06600 [Streptomyces abikoensis]
MYEAEIMTVATGAAGTLVAAGVSGGAHALRARIVALFRHGTSEEQAAALAVVEQEAGLTEGERIEALATRIAAYLVAHPDAIPEVKAVAADFKATTYYQHNTGSGIFIGRDHVGDLTINHGGSAQ